MPFELRDNSGSLFTLSDDERKTDKYPHKRGKCMIDGVEYIQSVWMKTSAKGVEWESCSFQRPREGRSEAPTRDDPRSDSDMWDQ